MTLSNQDYYLGEYEGLVWLSGISHAVFFTSYIIFAIKEYEWKHDTQKFLFSMSLTNPTIRICISF